MSVKPPNISCIPKEEIVLACVLQPAGLAPGMLSSVMLRKGLYSKLPDTFGSYADSKEVRQENGILRLCIPHKRNILILALGSSPWSRFWLDSSSWGLNSLCLRIWACGPGFRIGLWPPMPLLPHLPPLYPNHEHKFSVSLGCKLRYEVPRSFLTFLGSAKLFFQRDCHIVVLFNSE